MKEEINMQVTIEELYSKWRTFIGDLVGSGIGIHEDAEGEKLINDMRLIHNKLALTSLMQDRYILAVTGLQGAGKTTIVKQLYDLDDSLLPEGRGRGENVPVLITEGDVERPEGYVQYVIIDEDGKLNEFKEKVSDEKFKGLAEHYDKEIAWLELIVPYRYFNDSRKSLALLPGFEKDEWQKSQQLLKHVLYLSTSSIVVIRKDILARDSNRVMIDRVKDIYGNIKPIYVLTHGDVSQSENAGLYELLGEMLKLNVYEQDRLIISGQGEGFTEPWKDKLIEAIMKYGYLSEEAAVKQVEMIKRLSIDISTTIGKIDKILRNEETKRTLEADGVSPEKRANALNATYQRAYSKLLSEVEEELSRRLTERAPIARSNFNRYVEANTGFWKSLASRFSARALKEQEELHAAIIRAWNDSGNAKPEAVIFNTVTEIIEERSRFLQAPVETARREIPKIQSLREVAATVVESGSSNKSVAARKTQETSLDRVADFFDHSKKNEIATLNDQDVKTLTLMGAMLTRQALMAEPVIREASKVIDENKSNKSIRDVSDTTVKNVEKFVGDTDKLGELGTKILKSVPIILGVDIAADGESDILVNASNALKAIGIAIAPAQLLGILGGAFALTYGINAVQKVVHETNQRQLQLAQAGHAAIDKLPNLQTQAYVNSLKRVFEKIGEHLMEVHREKLGLNDSLGKLEKLQYSLRNIRNANDKLHKVVYENAGFII